MKVRIFDTTLRDGEQTVGVALAPEQKLQIARKLDALGVDAIEAGFPIISNGEMQAIKSISKDGLRAEICGLARTSKADIDAVVDCGLNYVHTFIATSEIHLTYKLKITKEEALEKAISSVEYAKSRGLQVEFSAEDATRTDRNFLGKMFGAVADAGADRIDIPDTVGYATPRHIFEITKLALDATKLPISVHCHNDLGLAVANTLAGIEAGASCAHVTVNGIGERAGNASLEELVMALHSLDFGKVKYETNVNTKLLYSTSKFVANLTGIKVQANKAIVGDNAFSHESGIHTHGMLSNPLTYEAIRPESVGRETGLRAGKHAGAHGISAMLKEYGIEPNRDEAHQILEDVKKVADKGGEISEVELLTIAKKVMKLEEFVNFVKLTGFSVSTGIGNMPYAFVELEVEGKKLIGTDYGNGPVDAALKAIQSAIGKRTQITLSDYKLNSISGGSDSLCEVTVRVQDKYDNSADGKKKGGDIVITSVGATIDGLNMLLLKDAKNRKRA